MAFTSRSFGIRRCVFTGVICSAAIGVIAGASGTVWLVAPAVGVAIVSAYFLSSWMARSFDVLMEAAAPAARTGCISDDFPASSVIQEFNRLAEALNSAARSIHHSQADLDRTHVQFIETLAQILDARDTYTAGHSIRVGSYAHAIALAMKVPAQEAENIRVAAQLHDIGKIGIPDAVLQKPGPLTANEYGLIKLHPQIGRRILEKMGKFHEFLQVVELHHENHDGSGYPYKLAGDRIPLAARIVHVADAFDSMVTNRHYRSALPLRSAILELRANAGTQFDPVVTLEMLKLIDAGKVEDVLLPAAGPVFAGFQESISVPVPLGATAG